jgi:hypothetical protein
MLKAGFLTRLGWWIFSNYPILPAELGPAVHSASNINEYQKTFLGVKHDWRIRLTTSPPSISQLSRQCGILNILQPYRPAWPVTGQLYLLLNTWTQVFHGSGGLDCSLLPWQCRQQVPYRLIFSLANLFCLFFITSHKIHQHFSSREATESKYIFIYQKWQFSPLQSSKG